MQLNHAEEMAKVERLELLYERDGRSDPGHPLHMRYTGLMAGAPSQAVGTAAQPDPATASPEGERTGVHES